MRDPDDVMRSTPNLRSILSSPAGSRRATAGQRADHGLVAGRRRARTGPRSSHRDRGDRRREANPAADVAELAAAAVGSSGPVRHPGTARDAAADAANARADQRCRALGSRSACPRVAAAAATARVPDIAATAETVTKLADYTYER